MKGKFIYGSIGYIKLKVISLLQNGKNIQVDMPVMNVKIQFVFGKCNQEF